MSVKNYLNNCLNNKGNISELLDLFLKQTKSTAGVIFKYSNRSYKTLCLKNIETNVSVKDKIINLKIDNLVDFETKDKIENCISIPIYIKKEKIGLVVLFNTKDGFSEEIINDITELISLVQFYILSLNKEPELDCKDLFIANISHEIRTPLNGVIGYNQLLLQTELNSVQQKYLHNMNSCSVQLMQIINDILDFSKLTSGKITLSSDCFNPKEILKSAYSALEQKIKNKKQKCIFNIYKSVPKIILSDKQKLIQILVNLISNASKYSKNKSIIVLTLKVEKDNLIFIVKDNGVGIEKKFQEKIFHAFERIECKDKICPGTGLGLAVSKKLANLLGGDILVESEPDSGSTFTVKTKFSPYKKDLEKFNKDKEIFKDKIVLIFQDDPSSLSEIFYKWDMLPILCSSPLEALRFILSNRYEFCTVLIDICTKSGIELAEQIKEERPLLPLIALSPVDNYTKTSNFNSVINKPVNEVELLNNIYSILEKNPSIFLDNKKLSSCSPSTNFDFNRKILIAEDIQYNRTLLINMLEILGYTNIDVAENGEIAWKMLKEKYKNGDPYDILLLDLKMPKVDGYEIVEKVRNKGWIIPKIIIITASILKEDRERCKKIGAKYFLNKPIDMKQLKEIMLYVSNLL